MDEDCSPGLYLFNIGWDTSTIFHELRDLKGKKTKLKSGLQFIVNSTMFNVSNTLLDLRVHELPSLHVFCETILKFEEVCFEGQTMKESSYKVGHRHDFPIFNVAKHSFLLIKNY